MPSLALTYFDMPGRARVLRKALALGGVAFDDRALPSDEIAALKPTLPYAMVPVLTVDDHELIAEAQAILRYIGRLTGAYPPATQPLARALCDEVLDSFDDLNERLLIPTYQEDDVDKKKKMRLALVDGALREALARIDARLAQFQTTHAFFRDNASIVWIHELVVWDYATTLRSGTLDHIPTTFVDAFPSILAVHEKVERATARLVPVPAGSVAATPPRQLTLTALDTGDNTDHAEPLRLALHVAGLTFTDERISREAFKALQPSLPNRQLPVLTVDGQCCAQSQALLRYIGTLGGLYPTDNTLQAARIDELLNHINELYFFFDPIYQESRRDALASVHEALADDVVPESLAGLDKRIAQWQGGSPFALGGDTLSVADLAIFGLVELLTSGALGYIPTSVVAPHARVVAAHAAVRRHPRVVDWLSHSHATQAM